MKLFPTSYISKVLNSSEEPVICITGRDEKSKRRYLIIKDFPVYGWIPAGKNVTDENEAIEIINKRSKDIKEYTKTGRYIEYPEVKGFSFRYPSNGYSENKKGYVLVTFKSLRGAEAYKKAAKTLGYEVMEIGIEDHHMRFMNVKGLNMGEWIDIPRKKDK